MQSIKDMANNNNNNGNNSNGRIKNVRGQRNLSGGKGVTLECNHCGYEWVYTGKRDFYVTCPNCLYKVHRARDVSK